MNSTGQRPVTLSDPPADKKTGILPGDSLAQAGIKTWRFLLSEMLSKEEGTRLGVDIEALHDMRVATRRMRAAFDLFRPAFQDKVLQPHLQGLRRVGRTLGKVRDLDVFMQKAERYQATHPVQAEQFLQDSNTLAPLLEGWQTQREAARQEMLEMLDGKQYRKFVTDFSAFLSEVPTPPKKFQLQPKPIQVRLQAPRLIYTHLAAVRAFEPILDVATIPQLHALRIQFKKLRYTLEFFREVLGAEVQLVINDLKKVQDHLGDLNDTSVATHLLSEFLMTWLRAQEMQSFNQRRSNAGLMQYLTYQHTEQYRLLSTFPETWEHFSRSDFRRNLALAICVL